MSNFTIHDLNTVPEASKAMLEKSKKTYGMVPNLHGVLAESPSTFEAYQTLHQLFSTSSFNADELTVVWQTINVEHECTYCVPAHTAIAGFMKVDSALSDALRNGEAMPTEKLQVLHDTTLIMVRERGNLSEQDMATFFAAGYGQQQLLEIILGLSQKVISNYVNHIAHTPVDKPFEKFAWTKA